MPAGPRVRLIAFPSILRFTAVAAGLAVLFTLAWQLAIRPSGPAEVYAHLTYQNGARWGSAPLLAAGNLAPGRYRLDEGVVRFETTAGAVVTLAAPAEFQFLAPDHIDLTQGRLTARMLRKFGQLTVKVGEMEVRDLGTAFGVNATDFQHTLVSVFDGMVAVSNRAIPGRELRLAKGESLVGPRSGLATLSKTAFAPEGFKDLWPLTVGVDEASKLVEFLPPGPLQHPLREYHSNDRILLYPELQNVQTAVPLSVDLSADVLNWPDSPVSPYPLPVGTRGKSYLVSYQPDPATFGDTPRRLTGTISFSRKILGVVCSDQGLDDSDRVLGDPDTDYRTPGQRRGLEEADKENYRGAKLPHDSIRISPDRHTITFDFYVSDEREQMRVIVGDD